MPESIIFTVVVRLYNELTNHRRGETLFKKFEIAGYKVSLHSEKKRKGRCNIEKYKVDLRKISVSGQKL